MGTTFANFMPSGYLPISIDLLKIFLRNLDPILSDPGALLGDKFLISRRMSLSSTERIASESLMLYVIYFWYSFP